MKRLIALLLALVMMMSCVSFAGAEETAVEAAVEEVAEAIDEAVTEVAVVEETAEEPQPAEEEAAPQEEPGETVEETPMEEVPETDPVEDPAEEPVEETTEEPAEDTEEVTEDAPAAEEAEEEPTDEPADEITEEVPAEEAVESDEVGTEDEYKVSDVTGCYSIDMAFVYEDDGLHLTVEFQHAVYPLGRTESDDQNIVVLLKNELGVTYEIPLGQFKETAKDNGYGTTQYHYNADILYPAELYVFGYQTVDAWVMDTMTRETGESKGYATTETIDKFFDFDSLADVTVDGDKVTITPTYYVPGAGAKLWVGIKISDAETLTRIVDADKTDADAVTIEKLGPGTYTGFIYEVKNEKENEHYEFTFTVGDWTAEPKVTLEQTGAGTVQMVINGQATQYQVAYQEGAATAYTNITCKNGTTTLKKLAVSTLQVKVTPIQGKQVSSNTTTAYLQVYDWGWATKPSVAAAQNMNTEGKLDITFSNTAYTAYAEEGLRVAYIVKADGVEYTCVVADDDTTSSTGDYCLKDKTTGKKIGEAVNNSWIVTVPYTAGSGNDTITVTPVAYDADGSLMFNGTAGSVKYKRANFSANVWATVPTVLSSTFRNQANFDVYFCGNVRDAIMTIDGEKYALSSADQYDFIDVYQTGAHFQVTVTYGGKLPYGSHKFTFAAIDPNEEGTVTSYGAASKAQTVKIAATPDWVSRKISLSVTQVDDTTVQLTYTKLADDTKSLLGYQLSVNDGEFKNIGGTVSGKNYVYTYTFAADEIDYTKATKFTVRAAGGYSREVSAEDAFYSKTPATKSVKLKELWMTAPTLKVTASKTNRCATITLTGAGNPDGYQLLWSADGKIWDTVNFGDDNKAEIEGYQTTITRTKVSDSDCSYTYELVAEANYTKNLYFKAKAVKKYGSGSVTYGNESAKATVKIAPSWVNKTTKVTLTQTGEYDFDISWKAMTDATAYDVVVKDDNDKTVNTETDVKIDDLPLSYSCGLDDPYTVEVWPYYVNADGQKDYVTEPSTATISMAYLFRKAPVVTVTKVTGVSIEGYVTYYGRCNNDEVWLVVTDPNGTPTEKCIAYSQTDAGAEGRQAHFTIAAFTESDGSYHYTPGTYRLYAYTEDSIAGVLATSTTVKATVKDAFLGATPVVKSVTQINERSFTLTLKKALASKAADGSRIVLTVRNKDDSAEYSDSYPINTTTFEIGLSADTAIDWSNAVIDIRTYTDYKEYNAYTEKDDTYPVAGGSTAVDTAKYLKNDFWKAVPTVKVTQVGYNTIKVELSGCKASLYTYVVTDLNHKSTDARTIAQNGSDIINVSDLAVGSALHVTVTPKVNADEASQYAGKASVTMNHNWDSVSNVALADADGKKGNQVRITYSYDGLAEGVYVQFRNASSGEELLYAPLTIDYDDDCVTVNGAKKTVAIVLDEPYVSGKYYVEVTPYLIESNDVVIGDSVVSAKAAKITTK